MLAKIVYSEIGKIESKIGRFNNIIEEQERLLLKTKKQRDELVDKAERLKFEMKIFERANE